MLDIKELAHEFIGSKIYTDQEKKQCDENGLVEFNL